MAAGLDYRIVLITGERQVGKSTALTRAVVRLRNAGLQVSGLLTRRSGPHDLEVTELHTGATYALTDPYTPEHTSPTRHFAMNAEALLRSGRAIAAGFPTEVFILDELGPLELVHHQGWAGAFELLHQETYQLAYIVVRPELLGALVSNLPGTEFVVLHVTDANRDAIPDRLVHLARSVSTSIRGREVDFPLSSSKEGTR